MKLYRGVKVINSLLMCEAESISFWESFVLLFAEMDVISAVCLLVGIVLVLVEIFQPGFGVFGIVGAIILLAGVIIRMCNNGNLAMLFIMLFFIFLFAVIGFLIMARLAKSGWLSRTPIVQNKSAVPVGITEGTKDFSSLIGSMGISTTILRPVGKAKISDDVYDVISKDGLVVEADEKIIVVGIEGQKILVEKYNANDENHIVLEKDIEE